MQIARAAVTLRAGDHMDAGEFLQRWTALPELEQAELLEGVVYMPSPVGPEHAEIHALVMGWLFTYLAGTPGLQVYDNPTLRLGPRDVPQPDALLCRVGRVRRGVGFLEGVPDLVIEVAYSSRAYDLHEKKRVHERAGIPEYLVLQIEEEIAAWFALGAEGYAPLPPGADGRLHSAIFPGLRLDPAALWAADAAALAASVQ